ncbi:hypothetical protein HOLleu_22643 [Holothuria leucospilota]|uniref:NACHT domain-containing protein n=1 Tax=Holothuria leucospilota TaxID=206669 RepID=A0A9Q1BZJ1_HOLLE|nr:hypothetical protein HOLleu_22643 [Holothuria leucospilota]
MQCTIFPHFAVNLLVRSLRRSYDKYCKLMPLPWDNMCIPVADLYTECQCTLRGKGISSTDLIRDRGIILGKRVIVIGEHGSGRTTLTKYIVQQWIQDSHSTCLLIYVPLREVTKEMTLSDVVKRDLPPDTTMDTKDIEMVLTCGKIRCLVILDGHEDLSKTYKESKTDGAEGDDEGDESTSLKSQTNNKVTIWDLLHGNLNDKYTNLHVWLTTREYRISKTSSPGEMVEMKGLSKKQLYQYIKKCVIYYSRESSEEINLPESNDDDNVPISYWDNKIDSIIKVERSSQKETNRIYLNIVKFILQNDCVSDFEETPLLLNITVHLMAGKYSSAITYLRDKVITNRNELMRNIIDCMEERYCQKKGFHEKDFTDLEQKVGEFAFRHSNELKHKVERNFWKQGIGEDDLKTCRDIALLKLSHETSADVERLASTSSNIEFYHPHIKDYLVARYVFDKTDCSRTLLEKFAQYTYEDRNTVLIYLSTLLQDSKFQQLCEVLQTYQKYDALIDCLLENGNYNTLQAIMENSGENHISINHLESTYHRKAVWTFCKKCKELKIKLSSLSFNPGDFLLFVTNLSLPTLTSVEFHQITGLSKPDFQKICAWLSEQQLKIDIRFNECTLWEEKERELREMSGPLSGTEGGSTVSFQYNGKRDTWDLKAYRSEV